MSTDLASLTTSRPVTPGGQHDVSQGHDTEMSGRLMSSDSSSYTNVSHELEAGEIAEMQFPRNSQNNGGRTYNGASACSSHTPSIAATATSWRANASPNGRATPVMSSSTTTVTELAEPRIPVSQIKPGPAWPSESQVQVAHTYAIRLENGAFMPLIRADELYRMDFTRLQATRDGAGMIILPALGQVRPELLNGQAENTFPASVSLITSLF